MPHSPDAPRHDKESRRRAREDKLAASLRENLLRRKAQARSRKSGGTDCAGGTVPVPPSVDLEAADLEAEDVVRDTDASNTTNANGEGGT
jgi:hypothetical protein